MIVNVGLRFDYFDANTTIPKDIKDPDIYNPFRKENIYNTYKQERIGLFLNETHTYYIKTVELSLLSSVLMTVV